MQLRSESILRAINNTSGKFNILTFPTHEAYQNNLGKLPHTFYLWQGKGIKGWNSSFRPLPANHILLDGTEGQIRPDMKFDIVLSQNKFGQFGVANQIAANLNLPLVSIEHTLPVPQWNKKHRDELLSMRGKINAFISEYSINQWGFDSNDSTVRTIHHGIDTEIFKPLGNKSDTVITCVNDWKNRDWCCGWNLYLEIKSYEYSTLQFVAVGDTKGFSEPAKSVQDLVNKYSSSLTFLNTSLISPVPTALLEAMSCGCACVSTDTCMIPEIIKDGYNGYLFSPDKPHVAADRLQYLSENPDKAREIGENARKTIIDKFSLDKHLTSWNDIFTSVYGTGY